MPRPVAWISQPARAPALPRPVESLLQPVPGGAAPP